MEAKRVRKVGARSRLGTDERRAQLLALGLEMFAGRSYDVISIDDVAAEAGISKGLLYHYFPTKRDFYVAVVKEAARQLLVLTDLTVTSEPLHGLIEGMERYLAFVEKRAATYSTLMRGGIGSDPELSGVIEQTRQVLLQRLAQGILDAGLEVPIDALTRLALRGWMGFVEATSLEWLDRKDVPRATLLALWSEELMTLLPRLHTLRASAARG